MLNNIRIVLVGTSHPGNIGSVARAMKTMGLTNLYLAEPRCEIDGQSVALAAGACDVLQNVTRVDSFAEAIADCDLVIGTSARSRTLDWPLLDPRQCGETMVAQATKGKVALVFGRENHGLSNEELQQCNYHVFIPANPEYSSLNLAQAVQLICYEARVASLSFVEAPEDTKDYANHTDHERFFAHLESTLASSGFIIQNHPGQVMVKLRRLFTKAQIEQHEMNILRGILTSVDKKIAQLEKVNSTDKQE